jgi:hypothetical protein
VGVRLIKSGLGPQSRNSLGGSRRRRVFVKLEPVKAQTPYEGVEELRFKRISL